MMAVHQMNIHFLFNVLNQDFFDKKSKLIMNELVGLYTELPSEFTNLINFFSEFMPRYQEKIFDCLKMFVEKFNYMIPVFGISFYQENLSNDKGITTVSFEDLKRFYMDIYEVITEMLELLIAFNNLKHRGSFRTMKSKRRDVITIDDYIKKNKGAKVEFLDGSETFDSLVYPSLNVKLRNAIGHYTYKVDGKTQIITYYPSGDEKDENPPIITLVGFVSTCWNIFQALINFSELVYQTRKLIYTKQGLMPPSRDILAIDTSVTKRKPKNNYRSKKKQQKESRKINRSKKI
jgi:hypothetical protein